MLGLYTPMLLIVLAGVYKMLCKASHEASGGITMEKRRRADSRYSKETRSEQPCNRETRTPSTLWKRRVVFVKACRAVGVANPGDAGVNVPG